MWSSLPGFSGGRKWNNQKSARWIIFWKRRRPCRTVWRSLRRIWQQTRYRATSTILLSMGRPSCLTDTRRHWDWAKTGRGSSCTIISLKKILSDRRGWQNLRPRRRRSCSKWWRRGDKVTAWMLATSEIPLENRRNKGRRMGMLVLRQMTRILTK